MKIYIILILLISNITFAKDLYLLETHDPHIIGPLKVYSTIEHNTGRLVLVSLKKNTPKRFFKYLKKITLKETSSYIANSQVKLLKNKLIQDSIDNIQVDDIKAIVSKMVSFKKRSAGTTDNFDASKYIEKEFINLGFEVEFDCFRTRSCNIYAKKKGLIEDTILVEAHLDSVGRPNAGADDNASGVAGLLLMAKEISKLNTNHSFIFFATNAEEKGLLGAKHYVDQLAKKDELKKIKFVINMDMIGYNKNGLVDLETNREFEDEAKLMAQIAMTYTSLTPNITIPAWGSDHVPFLKKGIPSVLSIEHWKTKTPCYHSACDKKDHLNYKYASEIIKLNLATVLYKSENSLNLK
jgi:aminopeptidase-like protein